MIDINRQLAVKQLIESFKKVFGEDPECMQDMAQILEDVLFERKDEALRKLFEGTDTGTLVLLKEYLFEKYKVQHTYE